MRDRSSDETLDSTARDGDPLDRASTMPPKAEGFSARYEVIGTLGQGGMGEVRLLRDGVIGRDVAIKLLRDDLRDPEGGLARLLREARVQGQLEHPAVVPVYDLGLDAQDRVFFTMKRVRGQSLSDVLAAPEATRSRRRLLTAFSTVCLAVDYAHARGVLHRDLKPSNIMLGDFGEVYLLDWGLARLHGVAEPTVAPLTLVDDNSVETVVGAVLGTPGYIAPEQLRSAPDLDARADVYSLGAILFEVLAHEPLHNQRTIAARVFSTASPGSLRPSARRPEANVPPELDALCERALAFDPKDRLPTARALSDAIERYLDGDRDLERRREASTAHAALARAALEQTRTPDADEARERAVAMREAVTALGLDASNRDALDTFVKLLSSPPRDVPPETRAELARSARVMQRNAMRWAVLSFGSFFATIPLLVWMGVRDVGRLALLFVFIGASAMLHAVGSRSRHADASIRWPVLIATNGAVALSSWLVGALWFTPLLSVTNVMGMVLTSGRARRGWAIALGCATVVVPLALELAGVTAPSYVFHDGRITVSSQILDLARVPTLIVMGTVAVGGVLGAGLMSAWFRDALTEAERTVLLHAWQLRQAVPAALASLDQAAKERPSDAPRR
jgi:eukaryotic-like serine/threonine-protein kinase